MDKKYQYFELLCDVAVLMQAWKQVRSNRGAAGVDMVSLAEYEANLIANLEDLAARIRDGRYFPMPLRRFQMEKPNGKKRSLGIFTVEDRIAQRAALNLLEPLWEPSFLECSYGFRPGRNVEMAVKQALDYRAAGDCWVADTDIADCFGSLDHEVIIRAVSERVRDKRMLNLIRMWLAAGQVFNTSAQTEAVPAVERLTGYAINTVTDAITHLLDDRGYGSGYGAYNPYPGYPVYSSNEEVDLPPNGAGAVQGSPLSSLLCKYCFAFVRCDDDSRRVSPDSLCRRFHHYDPNRSRSSDGTGPGRSQTGRIAIAVESRQNAHSEI